MSLSVINCPKAKVIDEIVSMVTKSNIPVVRLLIRCFMDTVSLSVLNSHKAKLIIEAVSIVTNLDIPVVRLLIKSFMVKRDTPSQPLLAPGQK